MSALEIETAELTYAVEEWRDFYPEAKPIMQRHWEEIALDKDRVKVSWNDHKYREMADNGILHVLAVRCEFKLVGYYLAFILPHLHYMEAGSMAFTDIYYILPEFRNAASSIEMFIEAEKTLRAKGCVKAYISSKIHKDLTPLFIYLGWKPSDVVCTKML
jgi:hypothetical protein